MPLNALSQIRLGSLVSYSILCGKALKITKQKLTLRRSFFFFFGLFFSFWGLIYSANRILLTLSIAPCICTPGSLVLVGRFVFWFWGTFIYSFLEIVSLLHTHSAAGLWTWSRVCVRVCVFARGHTLGGEKEVSCQVGSFRRPQLVLESVSRVRKQRVNLSPDSHGQQLRRFCQVIR